MSGSLVESVGFKAMIVGMGVICFLYAPLLFWLKEQFTLEDWSSLSFISSLRHKRIHKLISYI